ncbi:hypothetical protein [Janthinobacterium sp. SUN137]|uniref:hypothetical protein n=1 Tax=Janthinobacterium sp. SUN137 TaxID=3014789 RepID=UPI00271259CD|nr:hypothetical protein [Janthinobacterium sp. SUN137]MDO8039502.1 hypothetical protein [Janthinobacterium sp. SUN137]
MDGVTIQNRVYLGYAKAAAKIGIAHDLYRPTGSTSPLASGNRLASLPASFNAESFGYGRPNKYGKPTWYAVVDGAQTRVGDYLVGPSGTFFIAAQQALLPILAVECSNIITVLRPQQQTGIGAVGYGGDVDANETPLLIDWPASVLQGAKGEKNETNLPGDVRSPWWAVLLPALPGLLLHTADIITDNLGRRLVVSSAELTDMGWRITAMQALT